MFWYDPTIILVLIATVIGMAAQFGVQNTYRKYAQVSTRRGFTGSQVAQDLLRSGGCGDVQVGHIPGQLSDHFDPRTNTVNLSSGVYNSSSIAALGIAAHECGHVMQREEGYWPMKVRSAIVPLANLGSQACMPLILIGLLMNVAGLIEAGIILFGFAVIFQLVTLPVEFNASSRAIAALESGGYLEGGELDGAKKVLRAAAMTYVAAALASMLQLLRFVLLFGNRRD